MNKEQLIEKWEKERVELLNGLEKIRNVCDRMALISRETTLSDCIVCILIKICEEKRLITAANQNWRVCGYMSVFASVKHLS